MRPLGLKPALILGALRGAEAPLFHGAPQGRLLKRRSSTVLLGAGQLSETSIFVAGAIPAPAFFLDVIDATIRYPSNTSSTNA
jgi:hypothetical protein